mgnify:CR=1 FL=1
MSDSQEQLKELIGKIDATIVEAKPHVVIALNALSLMAASLAVRLGVPKDAYVADITVMFQDQLDAIKPQDTVDEQQS